MEREEEKGVIPKMRFPFEKLHPSFHESLSKVCLRPIW
jgi:hypothetical protein